MDDATAATPAILATIPLFADLGADELRELAGHLHRRRYAKGDPIFFRGEPGTGLCIIESGRVKIALRGEDGREAILSLLAPGSIFGELALLDGEPRSADAAALEDCELLLLQRDDFTGFLERHPAANAKLLAVVGRRLRANARVVQDAAQLDVAGRLARTLLDLAGEHGAADDAGVVHILPRLTQSELAGMIGSSRESVNKWLAYFERHKLLSVTKGHIALRDPEGLRRRVY